MVSGVLTALDQLLEPHHLRCRVRFQPASQQRLGEPSPRAFEVEHLSVGNDRSLRGHFTLERPLEVEEPAGRTGDRRSELQPQRADRERIGAGRPREAPDPAGEADGAGIAAAMDGTDSPDLVIGQPVSAQVENELEDVARRSADRRGCFADNHRPSVTRSANTPDPRRHRGRRARSLGKATASEMVDQAMTCQLLLVSGSLRTRSTNTAVLRAARAEAPPDSACVLYEGVAGLPHFNPDDETDPLPPAVADLRAQIHTADAVVFSTPEYAAALPGSFKNVLDWTIGDDQPNSIYEKPVSWINASPRGAVNAHDSLRKVLGYANAAVVEAACAEIPVTDSMIGADGLIIDRSVREQIAQVLATLADRACGGPWRHAT
jgi:chromate reductase